MVNLRDLPKHVQKQALAAAGVKEKPKKSPSSKLSGWCVQCGEAIASEPAWDRHVAATGCRRNLRCWPAPDLDSDPPPAPPGASTMSPARLVVGGQK